MNRVLLLLFLIAGEMILMMNHHHHVKAQLNHKIIAGGVLDPVSEIDASMARFMNAYSGCANPKTGDIFLIDYDTGALLSTAFRKVFLVNSTTNIISHYAGNGLDVDSYGDGEEAIYAGLNALLCTCDSKGDLYLYENGKIRVVNGTTKIISLFKAASSVSSLASDDTYIYYPDLSNKVIQKIHKETKVKSVFAGGGSDLTNGILATSAKISTPAGVAVGPDGSIYYCDSHTDGKVIRRVNTTGYVSTFAGTMGSICKIYDCGDGGLATSATLKYCAKMFVMNNGTLVFYDDTRLRTVNTKGYINAFAGTGDNSASYLGGTTGDGKAANVVPLSIINVLFGFGNVIYFNDKLARYRKIENGIVLNAFGGAKPSSTYLGEGARLINSYLFNIAPSFVFDSNNDIFFSGKNIIYKVVNDVIYRIAGGEDGDYVNVPARYAQFGTNLKLVIDSNNTIYFSDPTKHSIKMYEPSTGYVSRVVGTGVLGNGDTGDGTTIKLNSPNGLCVDENGHLIILDTVNCKIRKWNKTSKQVSTIMSGSCATSANGLSLASSTTNNPKGCVVDKSTGDIYFTESSLIRKIKKSDNKVYHIVGNGVQCLSATYKSDRCGEAKGPLQTSLAANINDIALHPSTNELYWAEVTTNEFGAIRKLNKTNLVQSVVTGADTFTYAQSKYETVGEWSDPLKTPIIPDRLSFSNDGKIYISESYAGYVKSIDSNNRVISIAGHYSSLGFYYNGENLTASETQLCKPTTIAKRENFDDLYIGITCETSTIPYSRIVKLDAQTGRINTIVGNYLNTLTADGLIGLQTAVNPSKSKSGTPLQHFPFGLQVNSIGEVFFADSGNHRIRKLKTDGTVVTVVGTGTMCASGTNPCGDGGDPLLANLNTPTGIFVTENGVIYIADRNNNRIRKVENNNITTIIGSGTQCGYGLTCDNSNPLLTLLNWPTNVVVSKKGEVYITDSSNSKIRKLSGGVMTVLLDKKASCSGEAAGCGENVTLSSASTYYPTGIFVDNANDDVYITDATRSIRRISQRTQKIYTYAGTMSTTYARFSESDIGGIKFKAPTGILQTKDGIVVADTDSGMIRLVKAQCPEGIEGLACDIFNCFGTLSTNQSVCSGHGTCTFTDTCSCNNGFNGTLCENAVCNGLLDTDPSVCSGNGACIDASCNCSEGYFGNDCEWTTCFGYPFNDTLNVCSGNGTCIGRNKCSCYEGFEGLQCDNIVDNSTTISGTNHTLNNSMTDMNTTTASNITSLNETNNNSTNNLNETIISNSTSMENSSSNSNFTDIESGNNSTNFTDTNNTTMSNSTETNNSTTMNSTLPNNSTTTPNITDSNNSSMSSNSTQVSDNSTSSNSTVFDNSTIGNNASSFNNITNNSTIPSSNNTILNSTSLTNSTTFNSTIIQQNSTTLNSTFIQQNSTFNNISNEENKSVETSCNSIPQNSSQVCSGRGSCISMNNCSCFNHYYGPNCEFTNIGITCYGKSQSDPTVCSQRGECISLNNCACFKNITNTIISGSECETTRCVANYYTSACSVYCKADETCSSHGNCSSIGHCNCYSDLNNGFWTNSDCTKCQANYYGDSCLVTVSPTAMFSNDGSQIELSLTGPTAYTSSSVDCSLLLSANDFKTLDSPPVCKWSNREKGEFVIILGYSNTLQPGSTLNINTNALNKIKATTSYIPLTILSALNPIKPVAIISTVTKTFSSCDEITIDGASSFDSFYTTLNYKWTIIASPNLGSKLLGLSLNNSILTFDSDFPSGTYSVQLAVSNKFGTQSDIGSYTFIKESITVPQVKISDSENIQIYAERVPIYVKQYITFKECTPNDTLEMSLISINWRQLEGPQTDFKQLENNDLVIESFSDQSAQHYVFEVVLTFMNRSTTNAKVSIDTIEPYFGIVLYQSHVNTTHVTINVETDPEEMLTKLATSTWSWSCRNIDSTLCSQQVLDQLAYHASKRSQVFDLASFGATSIIVSLQIKNSVGSLSVTFPEKKVIPIINVLTIIPSKPVVTTSDILTLQLMISVNGIVDGIDSVIKREWTLNDRPLDQNMLTIPVDPSESNIISLDISKLSEGSSNTLSCKVTSLVSGLSSVYSYSFTVAINPKPCYCSVSPSTGYALETLFSINCPNCLTADTSLQVAFLDSKTGLKIPLLDGTNTQISIQLPFTGSTSLPLFFTVKNTQTNAKTETSLKQAVLLPKVVSLSEVRKKKLSWDSFYKTLANGDPRKTVFDYITTTVNGMTSSLSGNKRMNREEDYCQNGGTFNNYIGMCTCVKGFKKTDCSLSLDQWEEVTNTRWITAKSIFEHFRARNEFEPQSEKKLNTQISILYHLLEIFDEVILEEYNEAFEIFQKQVADAKKAPYLVISKTLSDAMSSTLELLKKSKLSLNDIDITEFDEQVKKLLVDLSFIRYRNQVVGSHEYFDTDLIRLTSSKLYPTEMSNKRIEDKLEFPNMMTNYLNADKRKPINVRVWKQAVPLKITQSSKNVDGTDISISSRQSGYSLTMDMINQQQILNMPQKLVSNYFYFQKKVNSSFTSEIANKHSYKQTNISSQIICMTNDEENPSVCNRDAELVNLDGSEMYMCKCSPSTNAIHLAETSTTSIKYIPIPESTIRNDNNEQLPPRNSKKTNNFGYLAFLSAIPLIVCIIVIPIYIIIRKKKKEKEQVLEEEVELPNV